MSRKKSAPEQPSGLPPAQTVEQFAAQQAAEREQSQPMPSAPDVPGIDTTPPLEPLNHAGVEYAPGTPAANNGQPDQAAAVRAKKIAACLNWMRDEYSSVRKLRVGQKTVYSCATVYDGELKAHDIIALTENEIVRWYQHAAEKMGLEACLFDEAFAATMPQASKGSAE